MRKFLLMIFAISNILFLSACVAPPAGNTITTTTTITKVTTIPDQKYDTYTVRKNDTLQKIASKFAVTKEDLAKSNNISTTTTLHVGQKLKIPTPSTPVHIQPLAQHSLFWPTSGKVVRVFAKAGKGSKGIDIAGGLGQEIKASGDGKVVYSGASLSGFGNMVIVKHNDRVVTVYALNRKVLVKEGQLVKAGEVIGEMGSNKQGDVLLHFEVRVDGKPQDPLLYLVK